MLQAALFRFLLTSLVPTGLTARTALYVTSNQHGGQGDFGIAFFAIFKPLL